MTVAVLEKEMTEKQIEKIRASYTYAQNKARYVDKEWYSLRSLLGITWAWGYVLLGGREAGKSYAVMDLFLREWKTKHKPFTWLRLTEPSMQKMLSNKADKLIDADLRRKYDLDISVNGNQVFDGKEKMCKVLALNTFYNDKGVALYDNEYDLGYNICLDEMNREMTEKRTFDIAYAFVNQMENLVRSTKDNIRVFMIGNTLSQASDILCLLGFIPEHFGRYHLHNKRVVVDYIPPSLKYLKRRSGTIADLLTPESPTFTNQIEVDKSLLSKNRLVSPTYVIKFSRSKNDWFTVWNTRIINSYNGEQVVSIPMRPYLDDIFNTEARDNVIQSFDNRVYLFRNLYVQKNFARQLEILKPRKG